MFKSKGALVGVAAAVVGSALLLAGMAVSTTSGAGTDFGGAPSGFPSLTENPPASPIEPGTDTGTGTDPVGTTNPTDPNAGDAGAGGTGPNSLPDAGFGAESGTNASVFVAMLALAGAALVGAGATAARRRG
jgi:hypothetical protein